MSKWIEHRPDNCSDQPRFSGGVIVVAVVVALLWAVGVLILWWATGR